ncbi:hypothetical protein MMC26_001867 [Xylographa opegraphella]|nr:hypothetical protein [Xylographa opegraphella]
MDSYRSKRTSLNPDDALLANRHVGQVYDPVIMAYRPQKTPLPFTNSVSWDSADFYAAARPESRRSSTSSYASFGSAHSTFSTTQTTTSVGSSRSSFTTVQQRSRSTQPPPPVFKRLPLEIYDCILQQLRNIHTEPYIQSCATCYLRDLYNLALVSRTWDRAVQVQLYDRIHIVGHDSASQLKRCKMKSGVRLKLLRRTLRERRILAQYVHELKVPNLQPDSGDFSTEAIDTIASIVMACPNLEKLVGFCPTYNHTFNRLTYALSTRRKLQEHIWIVGENDEITARSQIQLPPGLMDTQQAASFIQCHDSWSSLTTLFLHSQPNAILEHDIFISVFERLPSLLHLAISSFDIDDFNDETLKYIPPLQSLRLESLSGVTCDGLSRYASSAAALPLRNLSLLALSISSLQLISKLLANLTSLARFSLSQELSPTLPADMFMVFQPLLASASLSYLHWDIRSPLASTATDHLASSIRAHGFPALRTIRAPTDPYGTLQALCKPRAQIVLPSDKYNAAAAELRKANPSLYARTLHAAREAAQQRIEAARNTVLFRIVVEEDGSVSQVYDLPGFVGTVGSRIDYLLKPDIPGAGDAICGWRDLLKDEGGRGSGDDGKLQRGVEGCTGLWNASHPAGKKWWWHTERARWKGIELDRFF